MGMSKRGDKERQRLKTYIRILEHRKVTEVTCFFCPNPIEVLHHKDENHGNNRDSNLLSVCKECHEKLEHGFESKGTLDEAISKSDITWSPDLMARSGIKKFKKRPDDRLDECKVYLGDSISGVYRSNTNTLTINLLTESSKAMKVIHRLGFKKVGGFL